VHAVQLVQQFRSTTGKNATELPLQPSAIEATPVSGAPGFFRRQDPAARERLDSAKPPKCTQARSV
jgi:hypothetical protein